MKTKTLSLFALSLLLSAAMLACGGGANDNAANAGAANTAGGANKGAANTSAANTTANTSASTTASSGDKIGVAECDDFIQKYEACINGKVPEAARSMVKAQLDAMRTSWKKAAETPQGKAGLAQGCQQALAQAKTSMGSYGCAW